MQRRFFVLICITLAVLFLTACSVVPTIDPADTAAPSTEDGAAGSQEPVESAGPDPCEFAFENGLDYEITALFFSPQDEPEWGDAAAVSIGEGGTVKVKLDFSDKACLFDIGTVDANGVNYDAFELMLMPGDTIRLTGSWCSGFFTVTHTDGSRDFYTAKVYWNTPAQAPEHIPVTVKDASFTCGETGSAIVHYMLAVLGNEDRAAYPALASALDALNSSRRDALEKLAISLEKAGLTDDANMENDETNAPSGVSITETISIVRSDSAIVSLLIATRTGDEEGDVAYSCANYDPASGEMLFPSDVLTDISPLTHLINLELKKSGSETELNEYRDHTDAFSGPSREYAFVLSDTAFMVTLNPNAFRCGSEKPETVTFLFQDNQFLVKPRYLQP